jgi:GT2 family glycosyltransferase
VPASTSPPTSAPTVAPASGLAPPTAADVCVIVPVWRGGDDLDACLAGLSAADPAPAQILVVADGAHPDDVVRAHRHAGVRVHPVPERRGPAAARNLGASLTDARVLLFVDADVVIHPDAVAVAARELADVDAVIGAYDDAPTDPGFLSQFKNLMNHHVHHRADPEGFTFWGACGAIHRDVLHAVGGFDAHRYPEPSIEDIELGYRLRAAGYRIRVQPAMAATHRKRWTPRSLVRTEVRNRALPWSELILSAGGFDDDLNIDRRGRAKVVLTGGVITGLATAHRPAGRRVAAASTVGLLTLDRDLLGFYVRHRGPGFAAATVPWLWFSYLYSGGAFAVALARHLTHRRSTT